MENNNENKPIYIGEEKKKDKSILIAGIAFIVSFFIGGAIIQYLLTIVISSINNISFNDLLNASNITKYYDYSIEVQNASLLTIALSNLISYLITIVVLIIILRNHLKNEFIKLIDMFKNKDLKKILIAIISIVSFVILAYLIDFIFKRITPQSNNQTLLELVIRSKYIVLILIPTIIFAPIVEEIFYRFIIFGSLKKYNLIFAFVIAALCFALPHMFSTSISKEWMLQLIPYLLCGFLLTLIYHLSDNIYVSIVGHMINNILAVIIIFI